MCLNNYLVRGVLTVILGIGAPLLFFLVLPILIYRQILAKLGPCFVKNLAKILRPQSQFFLSFNRPEAFNVLVWFKLSGKLNADLVKEKFRTNCILVRNDSGDLMFPELQQYATMFGGYAFWKWEESFNMDKHFHHLTLDQEADAHAHFEQMLQTPLPEKSSPWEFTFLEFGDNSDSHFICFKFHHSLCDGEATFDLLMRWTDSPSPRPPPLELPKTSCFRFFISIFEFISSYFNVIYTFTDITPMIFDASNLTGVRRFPMSRSFDLGQAKQLKSTVNVSMSTAMLGVLTGSIRRKLQNEGKSVPKGMLCLTTDLYPNHPKKLTNKVMILHMVLPVDTASGYKRLVMLEGQAQKERIVKWSSVSYLFLHVNGSLPKCWIAPIHPVNSILVSSFPGPRKQISIGGSPVKDLAFTLNGSMQALTVIISSYNEKFRYWLGVDGKICSTDKNSTEFVQYLDDELHELLHLQSITTV